MKRNFTDEETYITEYRIKDSQTKDAQIIVKTASGDYYTTPYIDENLHTIRYRMEQEHFDSEEYESNLRNKLFVARDFIMGVGGLGTSYSILASATHTIFASCGLICSVGLIAKNIYIKVKIAKKIRKSKNTGPDLDKHDISLGDEVVAKSRSAKNEVNIIFNRNDYLVAISSTSKEKNIFIPNKSDELEYTILTKVSILDADWDNLPEYHNYNDEINHARKKDAQPSSETYALLEQEKLEEFYKGFPYFEETEKDEVLEEDNLNNDNNYKRRL